MEWDPEILARLRSSPEEEIVRRKERKISARAARQQTMTPEIKMVVGDWHTDEHGNRVRMIYNAKTVDFEAIYPVNERTAAP